ncbi:MAG: abscisic acid-deficient protein Aba4 family protein, partial [Halioglobus sp.]
SLEAVMLLFQSPTAVLGGWIHYLVFDLFVGAWIVRDAKRQGISHWLVVPLLVVTLMAGPAGLMLYLLLRLALRKSLTLDEGQAVIAKPGE